MRSATSLGLLVSVLTLVTACGGRSDKHEGTSADDGGSGAVSGTGGTSPSAGSPAGGDAGTAGIAPGSGGSNAGTGGTKPGAGGTSQGTGGSIGGTGADGGTGSSTGGTGADGGSGGSVGGSAGQAGAPSGGMGGVAGASCDDVLNAYSDAYEKAITCDPSAAVDQCTQEITAGLSCGCQAFANADQTDALASLDEARKAYAERNCRSVNLCGACLAPIRGHCTDAGRCEGIPPGNGRSCKVGGKVYADGEGGIPDPTSCNTCSCEDGALACTEIGGCEKPCPDGYAFGSDCAQCGPTDGCDTMEYDCFKTCQDGCGDAGHFCISGVCVTGVCG